MSDLASVQTSALTGVWTTVHPRRQATHATADALILAAWQDDAAGIRTTRLVARYREQSNGQDPAHRYQTALSLILGTLASRMWLRTGTALALSAERAHQAGEQAAGEHIGTPVTPTTPTVAAVPGVLAAVLAATARRAARQLADDTGTPRQQAAALRALLLAAADLLTAADVLVSTAYGRGQFAAYQRSAVASVMWVTVGDGKVCKLCKDRAKASPYLLGEAPSLPAHPRCRCTLTPA